MLSRYLTFAAIILGFSIVIHIFLWWRLVHAPQWISTYARVFSIFLVLGCLAIPVGILSHRLLPREVSVHTGAAGLIWMAMMLYLFSGSLIFLCVDLFLRVPIFPIAFDASKRLFFTQIGALVTGIVSTGVVSAGYFHLRRGPIVKKISIPLKNLSKAWDGFRIVQLTDIHVGPNLGKEFIAPLVAQVNLLKADLIAITGDLVDGGVAELSSSVAALADLQSKYGTFFVTGNHEFYSGAKAWREHLSSMGMTVLSNDAVLLRRGDETLCIAGVEDPTATSFGESFDITESLKQREASCATILLSHQPKTIFQASAHKVDLQLSGHTHGGQIKPFHWLVRLQQPFVEGLHRVAETFLYVSPGTGYWGPPVRVDTRSEITEITLKCSST